MCPVSCRPCSLGLSWTSLSPGAVYSCLATPHCAAPGPPSVGAAPPSSRRGLPAPRQRKSGQLLSRDFSSQRNPQSQAPQNLKGPHCQPGEGPWDVGKHGVRWWGWGVEEAVAPWRPASVTCLRLQVWPCTRRHDAGTASPAGPAKAAVRAPGPREPDHLSHLSWLYGGPREQDSSPRRFPSLTAPSPHLGPSESCGTVTRTSGVGASLEERGQQGLQAPSSISNQRLMGSRSEPTHNSAGYYGNHSPASQNRGRYPGPPPPQNSGAERDTVWPEATDSCPLGVRYPFLEKKLRPTENESALLGTPHGGLARGQLAGSETINKPSFP